MAAPPPRLYRVPKRTRGKPALYLRARLSPRPAVTSHAGPDQSERSKGLKAKAAARTSNPEEGRLREKPQLQPRTGVLLKYRKIIHFTEDS